jgi:hypothetical protein
VRYSQLLLEFDLSKTTQRFGRKLLNRLLNDPSYYPDDRMGNGAKSTISAARFKLARKWRKADRPTNYDELVLDLAAEDVTRHVCQISAFMKYGGRGGAAGHEHGFLASKYFPDGYIVWWLQRYIDGGIPKWEDFHRVHRALVKYIGLQESGYFRRTPAAEPYRDLGRFKGLHDLETFLDTVKKDEEISNAEKDKPAPEEYRMLADTARWRVVVPLTQKAASYFGRNTKWCTTSENGNMFHSYSSRGPLYIVLDKPNNRRWQFHFPSEQYMNEQDRSVSLSSFPEDFWDAMPQEMLSDALKYNVASVLIYAPGSVYERMTPDVIGTLPVEAQTQFVKRAPYEGEHQEHYKECLKRIGLNALAIAYSVAWHWDQGPLIASQLFRRASRSTEVGAGQDWKVLKFASMPEALRYDLDQHGTTKEMWRYFDQFFRGQARNYGRLLDEFKNATMIVTPKKNYLFVRTDRHSQVATLWEGRERSSLSWYGFGDLILTGEDVNLREYDGPQDPEMWKALYKGLTEKTR